PEPIDDWRKIEIGRHGMTVTKNGRSAVFLPQVAPEQGWTLEQTLSQLCLKAGLRPDDFRSGATFTVFEAIVFSE
ncbi:MAG: AMMECR1 domain-containing protein, partial [Lentisphaeria bacterium]|nr:AMMECR1 domain-containing protein [Lentisphaeria bacterium]